jgi:endo-1,4-beta-mannosidase
MPAAFLPGINHPALGRWTDFSLERLESDFRRAGSLGARLVRLLLPWEQFQPARERVPEARLQQLESVLDAAARLDLRLLPVLFARLPGNPGGIPEWAVDPLSGPERGPSDFYRERDLLRPQQLQLQVLADAFVRHDALAGWDLGRETFSRTGFSR